MNRARESNRSRFPARGGRAGVRTAGPRLKARRGAIVALVGVFFAAVIAIGALTWDMSRLANLKAELQQSADAGAHAAIDAMIRAPANCPLILSRADAYALANLAMEGQVTVESTEVGIWIGNSFVNFLPNCFLYIPGVHNAVQVVVSRQSTGLVMTAFGVAPPRVTATALAWRCPAGTCATTRPVLVR
jgi:hypothetical protein